MAITQGNLGVVKNNLQLYYNRESVKSFRGEATTNIVTADYDNFENAVGSYSAINNTATRTNELFYFGGYSLKIARSSSGADGYVDMEGYINVSASTTYTYSVYVYTATITQSINILRPVYFTSANVYVGESVGGTITSSDVGKWKRVSHTFTTPNNCTKIIARLNVESSSYYPLVYYIDGRQIEQKSYATPFVTSARTANTYAGGGGLIDLSGNNYTADLNSAAVAFDSGGFYFNGDAAGALTTPVSNSTLDSLSNNTHTYEVWFKLLGTPPGTYDGYFFGRQGFHEGFAHYKSTPGTIFTITWYSDNTATGLGYTASLNTWYYGAYVVNVETATRKLYINGSLVDSGTLTKQLKQFTSPYYVGAASSAYAGNCIVSVARAHNRELTAAEITRNFESQRKVYGI